MPVMSKFTHGLAASSPHSRFVGSVAFFPEAYGEHVIELAIDMLEVANLHRPVFVRHQMVTVRNVDQLYPNHALIPMGDADSLLFSSR